MEGLNDDTAWVVARHDGANGLFERLRAGAENSVKARQHLNKIDNVPPLDLEFDPGNQAGFGVRRAKILAWFELKSRKITIREHNMTKLAGDSDRIRKQTVLTVVLGDTPRAVLANKHGEPVEPWQVLDEVLHDLFWEAVA